MGEHEISISFQELTRIEFECPQCHAGHIIDWTKQQAFPQSCSVCGVQFSVSARRAMDAHQQFYRAAVDSTLGFLFRIKAPQ